MGPLVLLSVALQIACGVHVVRTGRPMYWLFILLIGSYIGVAIYLLAEVLPGMGSNPTARRAFRNARDKIDPERNKRQAARQLDMADTIDNRRRLAEHSLESGDYQQALELYRKSLTGMYTTEPNLMLGMARAQFELGQAAEARATLDALIKANPKFRSPEGHLLYARAVEACGDDDAALQEFDAVSQGYPGEEARVRYAQLLRKVGRGTQATELLRDVIKRASLAPKYYQREQREWVDLAKRTLQELT